MNIIAIGDAVLGLCYIFLPILFSMIHSKISPSSNLLLKYYVFISVGIQGILTGMIQIVFSQIVVDYVRWDHSPFLSELGMANLSFGLLGLLAIRINIHWQKAAAFCYGCFLLITGIGHLVDIIYFGANAGNSGYFLWADLFIGIILLYLAWQPPDAKESLWI